MWGSLLVSPSQHSPSPCSSSTFAARPNALVAPPSGLTNWSVPMPFNARCWTRPPAALAAAMILLTACAGAWRS